jgi:hypothetical protein
VDDRGEELREARDKGGGVDDRDVERDDRGVDDRDVERGDTLGATRRVLHKRPRHTLLNILAVREILFLSLAKRLLPTGIGSI